MTGPPGLRLAPFPEADFPEYRRRVIFGACKWDPQAGDTGTIARHALLLDAAEADRLGGWAEALAAETVRLEEALAGDLRRAARLGLLPRPLRGLFAGAAGREARRHIRLMRFDFHPAAGGWALSEVNSDVPGGLAEASLLPALAAEALGRGRPGPGAAQALAGAFAGRLPPGGAVALVHATAYADDRQVMQCLGDLLEEAGLRAVYAGPDGLRWREGRAFCALGGQEGALDGLFRFFPLEWMPGLPSRCGWNGFGAARAPSCNHPVAFLSQSKRLPLAWDALGVEVPAWRALLPRTVDPRDADGSAEGWVFKPAYGRVGEGVWIPGVSPQAEGKAIRRDLRRRPGQWVAQRRFESVALETGYGERRHLCVGVFTVDGRRAGFYGRSSARARMDADAEDMAVLLDGPGEPPCAAT